MISKIRKELICFTDENYRLFTAKLLPPQTKILGIRIPILRQFAQRLAYENPGYAAIIIPDAFFEETMLQGLLIGILKVSPAEKFRLIESFLPKIDNWSLCDSFCASLKFAKNYKKEVWHFLLPYFHSTQAYKVRFATVMLLDYYVEPDYAEQAFKIIDTIQQKDYYVRMAIAWALSIYYIKLPVLTLAYLEKSPLDTFTYNKALQKAIESKHVSSSAKNKLRQMKRK